MPLLISLLAVSQISEVYPLCTSQKKFSRCARQREDVCMQGDTSGGAQLREASPLLRARPLLPARRVMGAAAL